MGWPPPLPLKKCASNTLLPTTDSMGSVSRVVAKVRVISLTINGYVKMKDGVRNDYFPLHLIITSFQSHNTLHKHPYFSIGNSPRDSLLD
jgi:hypothetical protein